MRRQTPIANALYNHLFPKASQSDPPSFAAHLARNLVPEVRIEVATFYGDLSSVESRYPGLDYCYGPHRMRLGRFKHHRRLFEAFDALGLTYQEIQDFCCWEGSRWARLKFEEDQGEKVMDTTGDEIGAWVDRRHGREPDERRRQSITRKTDISIIVEETSNSSPSTQHTAEHDDEEMADELDTQTPELLQHNSTASARPRGQHMSRHINQQIIEAWEQGRSLPPELEAMIKEQAERGELTSHALHTLINAGRTAGSYTHMPSVRSSHGSGERLTQLDTRAAA